MTNVILDCDNTFGLPGRPTDDGLALLYLLGKPSIQLLGVTTTYGNADVKTVYENTRTMLHDLGREDIPVIEGGASPGSRQSRAAEFLVEQSKKFRGELKILAVGALTNLCAADELDGVFFERLDELVLMGGITEPLYLHGIPLDELNFSCDPEAACRVLTKGKRLSIATGNNCLPAYMRHQDYKNRLLDACSPIGHYIYDHTKNWFETKVKRYDLNGFYNWDAVAAVYLLEKRFFTDHPYRCRPAVEELACGAIGQVSDAPMRTINLPEIRDVEGFVEEMYTHWLSVPI